MCLACKNCCPHKIKPFYGKVELNNGLIIPWLRFEVSKSEALRIATAQFSQIKQI